VVLLSIARYLYPRPEDIETHEAGDGASEAFLIDILVYCDVGYVLMIHKWP